MDGPNQYRNRQQAIAQSPTDISDSFPNEPTFTLADTSELFPKERSFTSPDVSKSMAAPGNRQHVVHQDYIVRQRYSNALPPPPGAPKLLEIPTQGLSAYCHPSYAQRLARAADINIEADAMLGMPIDLVGMPGIFDGDESCKYYSTLRVSLSYD